MTYEQFRDWYEEKERTTGTPTPIGIYLMAQREHARVCEEMAKRQRVLADDPETPYDDAKALGWQAVILTQAAARIRGEG